MVVSKSLSAPRRRTGPEEAGQRRHARRPSRSSGRRPGAVPRTRTDRGHEQGHADAEPPQDPPVAPRWKSVETTRTAPRRTRQGRGPRRRIPALGLDDELELVVDELPDEHGRAQDAGEDAEIAVAAAPSAGSPGSRRRCRPGAARPPPLPGASPLRRGRGRPRRSSGGARAGQTRRRWCGAASLGRTQARAEPPIPPRSPPVTRKPTSRLAWCGWKMSLTAIQNWVIDMAMKMSDQKLKAKMKRFSVALGEHEQGREGEDPPGVEVEGEPEEEQAPGGEAQRQRRVFPAGQAVEEPRVDGDGEADQDGRAEVEHPPPALVDADLEALLDRLDDREGEGDEEEVEEEEGRRPGLVRPDVDAQPAQEGVQPAIVQRPSPLPRPGGIQGVPKLFRAWSQSS